MIQYQPCDFTSCCIYTLSLMLLEIRTVANMGHPSDAEKNWSYLDNKLDGPARWKEVFPDCDSTMQSPINIESHHAVITRQLPPFNFFYYQVTENVFIKVVKSVKRTAQLTLISSKVIFLKGGGLPDIYKLDEFHFHWGLEPHTSSEHTIDGRHFPLELHIVHHQSKLYNFKTASSQPFGLAVVVFMFKLVTSENLGFKKFLGKFDSPSGYLENFALSEIIPVYENLEYYRYYGSMTSPPCTENVIWSIMKKPIPISGEQLKALKHVLNPTGNPLLHNHRPLQNRNRRPVFSAMFTASNDGLTQKAKYWLALHMVIRLF